MADDLIAAIATGGTRSAIGVVRLSGRGALAAVSGVFRPQSGKPLGDYPPGRLVYGGVYDAAGRPLDLCLATWSAAPHSYTGEETAELQCHGSHAVLTLVLEALFAQGARQAEPGEFTKRAFLNGKLDLLEAEAVADLIDAESPAAVRNAASQLAGRLSAGVEEVYSALTDLLAHFCAVLDYPDEEIDPLSAQTMAETLESGAECLKMLLSTYDRGKYLKDGLPTAIVGRPNVGKSSLLNALLGYDRAIVTDIPGTTRDTVEERCLFGGALLRLVDTAGIRETGDAVERLGVERSRQALEGAALALVLTDPGMEPSQEDGKLLAEAMGGGRKVILLRTKADLYPHRVSISSPDGPTVLNVSAKTGEGLDDLAAEIGRLFPQGEGNGGTLLTNARQAEAAKRALEGVEGARRALAAGMPPDAVLTDVEGALAALAQLTGRRVTDDVTDQIFSRFCVGK